MENLNNFDIQESLCIWGHQANYWISKFWVSHEWKTNYGCLKDYRRTKEAVIARPIWI